MCIITIEDVHMNYFLKGESDVQKSFLILMIITFFGDIYLILILRRELTMKKILHRILSAIICVAVMITPISANFDESDTTTVVTVETIISSGYDEIFANDNQILRTHSNNALQDTATTTYELIIDENDPTKGHLSLQITLSINGNLCSCLATGEIEAVDLSNDKYWDGCVQGDLCVEEKIYNDVYIHFNKLDSREDIRVSLSISTDQGPTLLVFGDLLLDEQTYLEIESHRNYGSIQRINSPQDSIGPTKYISAYSGK